MTREEAEGLIKKLPAYIPAPCPDCGAHTHEEAGKLCKPHSLPCGEYVCATPDCDENLSDTGPLYQLNPEWCELDGYLWGWFAVDEGFTTTPPTWREEPET